jgi:hypothetical protein
MTSPPSAVGTTPTDVAFLDGTSAAVVAMDQRNSPHRMHAGDPTYRTAALCAVPHEVAGR